VKKIKTTLFLPRDAFVITPQMTSDTCRAVHKTLIDRINFEFVINYFENFLWIYFNDLKESQRKKTFLLLKPQLNICWRGKKIQKTHLNFIFTSYGFEKFCVNSAKKNKTSHTEKCVYK